MFLSCASDTAPLSEKQVNVLFTFLTFCQKMHLPNAFVWILKKTEKAQKRDKGIEKPSAFILLEKCSKIEALHVIPGACFTILLQL